MSNLTNIPKQSYFSAQLNSPIDATQTTGIFLTDVPSYSPTGETVYFNITDGNNPETISATSWNSVTKELTGTVVRGISTYTGEVTTGSPHGAGVTVVLSDDWNYFLAIQTAVNSKFDSTGGVITGPTSFSGASTTFRIPNLTTAQIAALASPLNGMLVFDTDLGEFQYYDGGVWQAVGTATVSNASETVAGIVELATGAQMAAGTSVGETGARLVPPNSQVTGTSVGAADENKLATLNASGVFADGFINAATSGASKTVKSKANATLDDSLLAMTTAGDMTYSDGTDLTRIPIGTKFEVLRTNAAENAPEFGGDVFSVSTHTDNEFFTYTFVGADDNDVNKAGFSPADSGSYVTLTNSNSGTQYISWNLMGHNPNVNFNFSNTKELRVKFRGIVAANALGSGEYMGFGLGDPTGGVFSANEASITASVRVLFKQDGSEWLVTANGSAVTATAVTISSPETWNTYELVVRMGTSVALYVNGTLLATNTTNLPTSGTAQLGFGADADVGGDFRNSPFNISLES